MAISYDHQDEVNKLNLHNKIEIDELMEAWNILLPKLYFSYFINY
jgi:hypothetical protein